MQCQSPLKEGLFAMKINEIVNQVLAAGRVVYVAQTNQDVDQEIVALGQLEVRLLQQPLMENGVYKYVVLRRKKFGYQVLGSYCC
jgi:hypothetical protein